MKKNQDDRIARIVALMHDGRSHDEIAKILDLGSRRLYQIKSAHDREISEALATLENEQKEVAIAHGVSVCRAVEVSRSGGAFAREMAGLAAQYTPESIEILVSIRDSPESRNQDKLRAIEQLTRIAGLSSEFVARSLEFDQNQDQSQGVPSDLTAQLIESILGRPPSGV